jgi:sugar lactone lactonase YvrE
VWDVAEKALYWIDGGAPAIYRLDPKTNNIKSWKTPKPIGSFALREKGGAVLALSDGFYLFDFELGEAKQIGEPAAKRGTTSMTARPMRAADSLRAPWTPSSPSRLDRSLASTRR